MSRKTKTVVKKSKANKAAIRKPWGGRFKEETDAIAEEMNRSLDFDKRLYKHDIRGSIAHAKVLRRASVLSAKELERIVKGLESIEREIERGKVEFSPEAEDIHMAVEMRLTEKIGRLGGKLHTARSRNDQVALDMRLYLKDEIGEITRLITELRRALVKVAKKNIDAIMPGYTHLQRAQPVLFAHHMLAYYEMFARDAERLADTLERVDVLPLGSGALAGSPYKIDRKYTAKLLGFSKVSRNSLDAVSDRDFVVEFLSNAALVMTHLSRLAEELILFSSQEFGFVKLSDAFSTGSSIMPQKKNPDIAELVRGKSGRVIGSLVTLLTVIKALPLAYNKDMQEDKEPLFDVVDTIKLSLGAFSPMISTMKVEKRAMRKATTSGYLTATDAADYLVGKGVPFRRAHEAVGKAVRYCEENSKTLDELTLSQWRGFSRHFDEKIKKIVEVESSVRARATSGGTAPSMVSREIARAERELKRG